MVPSHEKARHRLVVIPDPKQPESRRRAPMVGSGPSSRVERAYGDDETFQFDGFIRDRTLAPLHVI
jgi:hypothetical protein